METLATRIKRLRIEIGLTQTQLATVVGVAQSVVAGWETGARKSPKADSMLKLAEVFGIGPTELMGTTTQKNASVSTEELQMLVTFRVLSAEKKLIAIKLLKALK